MRKIAIFRTDKTTGETTNVGAYGARHAHIPPAELRALAGRDVTGRNARAARSGQPVIYEAREA